MRLFGNRDIIGHGGTRMNLTLKLTPEAEAKLKARAASSGKSAEELALEAIDVELSEHAKPPGRLTRQERIRLFNQWAASQKFVSHPVDDSREGIYEGRGE